MTKILLIDDEADLLFTYAKAFEAEGFETVRATDGVTGLSLIETEKPDLITLDLVMSPMDGFAVFDKLKSDPETRDIPVVILTNMTRVGLYDEFMDKGATAFCEKTDYQPMELAKKVKEILKN